MPLLTNKQLFTNDVIANEHSSLLVALLDESEAKLLVRVAVRPIFEKKGFEIEYHDIDSLSVISHDVFSEQSLFANKKCHIIFVDAPLLSSHKNTVHALLKSSSEKNVICIVPKQITTQQVTAFSQSFDLIISLLSEKPWESLNRVKGEVFNILHSSKCQIDVLALDAIAAYSYPNYSRFMNEVKKLLVYVGERKTITFDDVHLFSTVTSAEKQWDIAETLCWNFNKPISFKSLNEKDFYSLLGQLRFRYAIAIQIKEGVKEIKGSPRLISEFRQRSRSLNLLYFIESQLFVNSLEIESKTLSLPLAVLWDKLFFNLKRLYDTYAK